MKLRLQIVDVPGSAPSFEHAGPVLEIGRDPGCDLSFGAHASQAVSWRHARIEIQPQGAVVTDLKSSNGTFVNDRRIDGRVRVKPGDYLRLGRTGPVLRVVELDLVKHAEKHPAAAPAPPGALVAAPPPLRQPPAATMPEAPRVSNGHAPVNRGPSTTRRMLTAMESNQKKIYLAAGSGAACVLAVIGVILWAHRSHLQDVSHQTSELSGKTEGLAQKTSSMASQLEEISAGDSSNMFQQYGDAVYFVVGNGWVGTAFAVDASGVFATNAHVAKPVADDLARGVPGGVLVSQGGVRRYAIKAARYHRNYIDHNVHSADVGILKVELGAGPRIPTVVQLAREADLRQLQPGSALCYIGFPVYAGNDYSSLSKVNARVYPGHLTRILTFTEEKGDFEHSLQLEHDMLGWGGASGSPIFDKHGKVVGLHNGANSVDISTDPNKHQFVRSAAGAKWGVRADLLNELLASR